MIKCVAAELVQALVISAVPYSETSLLVQLLTRERGLVRALAKGARRHGARAAVPAAYEPFTWIESQLTQRRADGLGTATKVEIRQDRDWLRHDLPRLGYAALALEVIAAVAALSAPEPFFFAEGLRYLTLLEHVHAPGSLTCVLLLRLLHHAGFPPRLCPELVEARQSGNLPLRLSYQFQTGLVAPAAPSNALYHYRLALKNIAPFIGVGDEPNWLETIPPIESELRLTARTGPVALRWLIQVWEDHLHTQFSAAQFLNKMVLHPRSPA